MQFLGTWYGVQSSRDVPVCEIHTIARGEIPFKYFLISETKLNNTKYKFETTTTEYLRVLDQKVPAKMNFSPLPRKKFHSFHINQRN